jgi:hypothetical protein
VPAAVCKLRLIFLIVNFERRHSHSNEFRVRADSDRPWRSLDYDQDRFQPRKSATARTA